MKNFLLISFMAATLFAGCNQTAQTDALTSKNDSLQTVINERDAVIQEMIGAMNLVEEGFRAINEAQGRINISTLGNEINRKDVIASNLSFINETLASNKAEIERLKAQIDNNKVATAQMKQMINNLQQQLIQKSEEIAALRALLAKKDLDIAQLDSTVTELAVINADKERTILQQESEANAVWYAIGTKRELKNEGILKGGDVLLGKDANFDYFTKADKRELSVVNTHSRSAKLLTSHPEDSYTLLRDENKQYILRITNPDRFWCLSRYLVILVKS